MITKEKWMKQALNQAIKAYDNDEVPIGSIIVKNEVIIGRGFNQIESLNDCTAHSEIIAITSASNTINDWRLNDCSLYVTKEPCIMCFGAIVNSRIKNLYFGFSDKENGFREVIKKDKLFNANHLELCESGILELDCKAIIKNFFIEKRKNNNKSSAK